MKTKVSRLIHCFFLCIFFLLLPKAHKAQSSLYMPAATNWVSVGDLDVAGNQLTVEALIYYTGASVDIVSKHTNPGDVNYLLRIGSFEITTTSGFAAFSGAAAAGVSLAANRMYHVAATYDGAMLKYYVNGCLTGSMAWTGNMVQNNLLTAIGNMSTCQCEQFTGYIDEVRIWNVCRTQAQISTNMTNLPSPTTQPGLLGYWKFDGTYTNLQGNATFDGVPQGSPQFQQVPLPYPTTLHESVTSSDPICQGDAGGVINVSATGYYTPYQYSLDGITYGSSPVFTGLAAGTYTVYTRPNNNNSCAVSSPVTITDPPVLNANLTTTNASCFSGTNGTANVAPSGGDGPNYHQVWQPSLNTATGITGLAAGNYSVTVMDTCKASGPELVTNGHFEDGNTGFSTGYTCCTGGPGNYAVDVDPVYYNGGHAGSGYGGGGNYLIVDGSTVAGTSMWCQSITVTPNTYYNLSAMVASDYNSVLAVVEFDINGTSVGTITAPPTTFTWIPFQTAWFSGASTTANICLVDQNTIGGGNDFGIDNISFKTCASCSKNFPFTITEPTVISPSTTQTNVSCNGGSDGTATASATGGTPGYTYSWNTSPLQSTATATNLAAGTYTVTVTDANLCTATATVTITQAPALTIALNSQTNVSCNGGNNGSATAAAAGGTPGYSYSWNTSPAQTTATANNLSAGTYTVTVTDNNSCSTFTTITITEPSAVSVSLSTQNNVSCNGGNNGDATVTASGGTTGYTYSWNSTPTQTVATASNLTAGTYTVIVNDLNACIDSLAVTITEPTALNLVVSGKTNPSCFGNADGTIHVTASGGTSPYSYVWSPNVSTADSAISLSSGSYDITVTDANGCTKLVTAVLTDPNLLTVNATASPGSICRGSATALNAVTAGGTGSYTFGWSNAVNTASQTAHPLINTTYTVTVTDSMSCSAIDSIAVTVFQPVPVHLGNDTAICQGDVLTLDAGTGYAGYLWQNGTTLQTLNASVADMYFVSATDANGCIVKDTLILNINPLPVIGLADTLKICPGTSGTLTANSGYTSYAWNTGEVTSSISVTAPGSDKVTVQDANGCINSDSTFVQLYPIPQLSFVVQPLNGCQPLDVTTQNNSILNGSVIQSWSWHIGTDSFNIAAPFTTLSTAGLYDVSLQAITDKGCIVDTLLTNYVEVYPTPIALIIPQSLEYELTDDEMYINNYSSNADTYEWSIYNQIVSQDVNLVYPVTDTGHFNFQLLAMNHYGCKDSTNAIITVNPSSALYFPNSFTPNGNGNDDVYMPKGYGIKTFEMQIYDRWGNLVFKTTDITLGWDGTVGGAAPFRDVYVYRCKMKDIKDNLHYYTGSITLIQ